LLVIFPVLGVARGGGPHPSTRLMKPVVCVGVWVRSRVGGSTTKKNPEFYRRPRDQRSGGEVDNAYSSRADRDWLHRNHIKATIHIAAINQWIRHE
ncbi:hypothetical protein, partial [Nocardia sp. NPDC059239]|uniref:hypothetical protein n=1 Tax=Nocardia sp. NPDC059239 TaxID=3346785 RepID=UPI0036AB2388